MYVKLAFRNVKRSMKDYLIYLVTMTVCVTLFYAFLSITSVYYDPGIGIEYEFRLVSGGMKLAVCGITLLLLFLIRYVNSYMLRRRQKEFAVQSVMGMEQGTIAWIFFAETFLLGMIAIAVGICLGVFCSQFITGMLLSAYGQSYQLAWTLFPDTVLLTAGFFSLSLVVVGLFHVRTIRKIKIIDMLYADRFNDPHIGESRYMHVTAALYMFVLFFMTAEGISQMHFYSAPRFPAPVHVMFWGNIAAPAVSALLGFLWCVLRRVLHKRWAFRWYILAAACLSLVDIGFAASVPAVQRRYYLSNGQGRMNSYLLFLLANIIFLICCVIYLAGYLLADWKDRHPGSKYKGSNLFFFGQVISKLHSVSKTMTLICLTLVLSVFLFVAGPALTEWSSGYLETRSMYDVQISTRYNNVYDEADLAGDDYGLVTDFFREKGIEVVCDCPFALYLPRREDFCNRAKLDFPVAAISLSDYNALRDMLGYERISLGEGEFTTQWKTIAGEEEREEFLNSHPVVSTDVGNLTLADFAYHEEAIGETAYNAYTHVLYVFPDSVCVGLLAVMHNRYVRTGMPIPYADAVFLENAFEAAYPAEPENGEGVQYHIRTRTRQVNDVVGSNFVLQSSMIYSGIVLMIICLTILSLQQLSDSAHYRYRFGVLHKLGVDRREAERLVLKQLAVWFGLPVMTAAVVSVVVAAYFFGMIHDQIDAYIGAGDLFVQVAAVVCILVLLLVCYFVSTWILFRRAIAE